MDRDEVVQLLIILALIASTLSILVFARAPWWKSDVGINLMVYMFTISLLLAMGLAREALPEGFYRIGSIVVFSAFVAVKWWRLVILIKSQTWRQRDVESHEST